MLGGEDDEDDELQELVRACGSQAEPPRLRLVENVRGSEEEPARETSSGLTATEATPQQQPGPSGMFLDPTVRALIDQNNRLMEMVKQQTEEPAKRKEREEVSYATQEPVLLFYESYRIEDDAHDKIDTFLRQNLRPINVDPATYWTKTAFKRVDRPSEALLFT